MTGTGIENSAYFFLCAGFASFVLYCRLFGVFGQDAYYSLVGKTHLAFCMLTVFGFVVWCQQHGAPTSQIALHAAGLTFLFFLIHYGFFHAIVGLIKKSSSVIMLMLLGNNRGEGGMSERELSTTYADGRGTQFLVDSRIKHLRELGWIEGDVELRVTRLGFRVARIHTFLKNVFRTKTPVEKALLPQSQRKK